MGAGRVEGFAVSARQCYVETWQEQAAAARPAGATHRSSAAATWYPMSPGRPSLKSTTRPASFCRA